MIRKNYLPCLKEAQWTMIVKMLRSLKPAGRENTKTRMQRMIKNLYSDSSMIYKNLFKNSSSDKAVLKVSGAK